LSAADSRRIPCWGQKSFTVSIGGIPRRWGFLLAAVSFPISGIDFLRHHGLLVDVANLRLLPGRPSDAPAASTADQAVAAVNPAPMRMS
jgi:cleavage and polyadenylation specificity factor subunit 1